MKDSELDILARNLLQHAEEPVSPRVWKGVNAALDKQRPRVVPFWVWSLAGVAAAAAVVLGVFLLKPAASEQPVPDRILAEVPVTVDEPQPEEIVPTIEEQIAAKPARTAWTAPSKAVEEAVAEEAIVPETEAETLPAEELEPLTEQELVIQQPAETQALPSESDMEKIQQLAREESKPAARRRFSVQVSGNVQGNQRGDVSTSAWMRASRPSLELGTKEEGIYNEYPEVSFNLPLSVGLGFKFGMGNRWAVGTGVRYTNLSRTFVGEYVDASGWNIGETDIDNQQHWLGIPLNIYFDLVNRGSWRVSSFVGGAAEYLLDNHFLVHSASSDIHYHKGTAPIQWSCAVGVGVEFKISPRVGIFLDPSFRYYFGTEQQPRSIRTIQPTRVDVETGLRFSF